MSNSKEIVLVGNGPVATEREAAAEIESFKTIVRFNNFVTMGFEKYVGERTDIWATRICGTIQRKNPKNFREIIGVINYCKYTPAINALLPKWVAMYPDITVIYSEQVETYAAKFGYNPQENWLSVGIITLMHLLDYGYEQIYLYGFAGDPSKHYFKRSPRDPHFHRFDLETQYIQKLEKEGKVIRI